MRSHLWNRFMRAGALLALTTLALASVAGAEPAPRPGRRALNLFATSGLLLEANRVQCGLDNVGQVCVAFSGSPVGGGGFWPKGDRKSTRLNSSHSQISYAVFCLKKKKKEKHTEMYLYKK